MSIRVQGEEFKNLRPYLKFKSYSISINGNIKVNLVHKETNKEYYHWLNDAEKNKFLPVRHKYRRVKY